MTPIDTIIRLTQKGDRARSKGDDDDLLAAYRSLTIQDGQELARRALTLGSEDAEEELLLNLACLVPGSLEGIHRELLVRHRFWPSELYRGADAYVRDTMIGWLRERPERDWHVRNHLLCCLAWMDDVEDQFREWRDRPPVWRPFLHVPVEDYAREAGWELTTEGARRELFFRTAYRLTAVAGEFIAPVEDCCPWCERPLVTALLADPTDPRLSHIGISGKRLRVVTCDYCIIYTTIYAEFDECGSSKWSVYNLLPTTPYSLRDLPAPPRASRSWGERRMVLGTVRRSPYEAHKFALQGGGIHPGQIGGHPMWIDDAVYPRCPRCRETMMNIAQVDDDSDGMVYIFLCSPCSLAATLHQTT